MRKASNPALKITRKPMFLTNVHVKRTRSEANSEQLSGNTFKCSKTVDSPSAYCYDEYNKQIRDLI